MFKRESEYFAFFLFVFSEHGRVHLGDAEDDELGGHGQVKIGGDKEEDVNEKEEEREKEAEAGDGAEKKRKPESEVAIDVKADEDAEEEEDAMSEVS